MESVTSKGRESESGGGMPAASASGSLSTAEEPGSWESASDLSAR